MRFEHKIFHKTPNVQGVAVVNYTSKNVPYTRSIEHKHFLATDSDVSVVSYEYPCVSDGTTPPSYPVDSPHNRALYEEYKQMAKQIYPNMEFGGRLGEYKYYSMNDIIEKFLV